jgi:chromosome segregation ATPase
MLFFLSKRLWLVAAGVVLITSLGLGTVWSYIRTAHNELGKTIRDTVPISFELKRLEQATQDLIPEIRANQKVAAQLDVETEFLAKEIQATEDSQAKAKGQMQKLRESLSKAGDAYEFGGRKFTRPEVEQDLSQRLERYDSAAVQMAAKRKILQDRRQTLAAATGKIRDYRQQHEMLVEKAEALKGELKLVELAQETGNFEFNQSKLGQAKELAEQVEKRIRTVQKLVENERMVVSGEIPVEVDARPAEQRFDEYFHAKK